MINSDSDSGCGKNEGMNISGSESASVSACASMNTCSLDNQFVTLLSQSSKLIQQATKFLICDNDEEEVANNDNNDSSNDCNRKRCLEVIMSSNEAMLDASEKFLEKRKNKKNTELKKQKNQHSIESSTITASNSRVTSFESIIGSQDAKLALYENLILPLSMTAVDRKKVFQGVLAGGGNVLLYGPPGNGKTLLAQAAANEANAELFAIRPSEILSKYQGESEKYISNIFTEAKKHPRSVIFFDEFDSIATSRGGKIEDCAMHRRLLAELLLQLSIHSQLNFSSTAGGVCITEFEGHGENGGVNVTPLNSYSSVTSDDINRVTHNSTYNNHSSPTTAPASGDKAAVVAPLVEPLCANPNSSHDNALVVIAATNRLDDLDEAVIRRFDAKVYVGVPDKCGRENMISFFLKGIQHQMDQANNSQVAGYTIGWSGSEMQTLCREAAMAPLREIMSANSGDSTFNSISSNSSSAKIKRILSAEKVRAVTIADFDAAYQVLVREPSDSITEEIDQAFEKAQSLCKMI